jgi:acyl-coenzyme A thioesterase PaaI-like protein
MTDTGMPFSNLMGVEILVREKDRVVGKLKVREDLCTSGGILHGGAYMAFADALGAIGGVLNLAPGRAPPRWRARPTSCAARR